MRNLSDVIVKPIITEKAMSSLGEKCYTFEVAKDANKPEIAAAVEAMFDGVKVASVNVINMKKKPKRLGVHMGYTGEWKKAIVTLTAESKGIAFFESLN